MDIEKKKKAWRRWYLKHKNTKKFKLNRKKYREKYEDKRKINDKKYKVKNRIKIKQQSIEYRKNHKNKPQSKAWWSKYRKTEKYRRHRTNMMNLRRSKIKETDITSDWLVDLYNATTECIDCNKIMENNGRYPDGKHLDHVKPLSRGGTHTKDNVRYICAKCNLIKGNN